MNVAVVDTGARSRLKRWFSLPAGKKRWAPHVFLNIVSVVVILWVLVFEWFAAYWHFGIEAQEVRCLPYSYFLMAQEPPSSVERGKLYRYTATGLGPVVPEGTQMTKIAAAVAGDEVVVDAEGIHINGVTWGGINPLVLEKTSKSLAEIQARYVVPDGKVLMLGTLPRSYDGRYWGLIDIAQVQGRAVALW